MSAAIEHITDVRHRRRDRPLLANFVEKLAVKAERIERRSRVIRVAGFSLPFLAAAWGSAW
jgi:hypothetical protein